MPTAVERQVTAYNDSAIEASQLATSCWDSYRYVQELVLLGPGIAEGAQAVAQYLTQDSLGALRMLLGAMGSVLRMGAVLREHDFKLEGIDEFNEALRKIRFLVADATDATNGGNQESLPSHSRSAESFEELAKKSPPPQSWYEEDFRAARGPTLK
jgi:hypothetical protein